MESGNVAKEVKAIPLALMLFAVLALLFFRVSIGGDMPSVLSDEYSYAAASQSLWLHQAPAIGVPATGNWLYLGINALDFALNANFLTLARVWNVLALACCCFVFVLTFHKLAGGFLSGAVIAILAVSFGGGYGRLFMPEAMQFAVMTCAICAFFKLATHPTTCRTIVLGITLGLAIQVKIHAFLMVPCFIVGICLAAYIHKRSIVTLGKLLASFLCSVVITILTLRFAISGQYDLNLLGDFYSGLAKQSGTTWARVPSYLYVVKRHLATLFLLFTPAIATVIAALAGIRREATPLNALRCTILVAAIAAGGMLLVSAAFTVSIDGSGPHESINRIHGRYYEHLLLLLAALSAICATVFYREISRKLRWAIFFISAIGLFLSYKATHGFGWQNPSDFVAAFGLYWLPHARQMALALGACTIFAVFIRPTQASSAALFALTVVLTFSAFEYDRLVTHTAPGGADRAAAMLAATAVNGEGGRIVILSPQINTDFYRAGFHLLKYNPQLLIVPTFANDEAHCPVDTTATSWLLVVSTMGKTSCGDFVQVTRFDDSTVYSSRSPRSRP